MTFTCNEYEIEQWIWDTLGSENGFSDLRMRGFPVGNYVRRQLELPGCGIPDLVSFSVFKRSQNRYNATVSLFELKKGRARAADLCQISKYMSFFNENKYDILMCAGLKDIEKVYLHIEGYLVCTGFESDIIAAINNAGFINALQYTVDPSVGIRFRNLTIDYPTPYRIDVEYISEFVKSFNFKKHFKQSYSEFIDRNDELETEVEFTF